MNISVILPAAGVGSRFVAEGASFSGGAAASKIEFELDHKPVFLHAIEAFRGATVSVGHVGQIILAIHPDRLDDFRFRWEDKLRFLEVTLVPGGTAERWETVKLALDAVLPGATHIAVHDAARPVVSPKLIERVFAAAEHLPAVIPGLPVSSTLKRAAPPETPETPEEAAAISGGASGALDDILGADTNPTAGARRVLDTVSREDVVAIQTPQVFEVSLLRRAYEQAENLAGVTDDAGLIEALGEPVHVVEGDPGNIKITHPGDAELAAALIAHRKHADAKQRAVVDLFGDDDD